MGVVLVCLTCAATVAGLLVKLHLMRKLTAHESRLQDKAGPA